MLYGAIIGDIIGSRYEFDRGGLTKDFELFTEESEFTDDTVMTVAVADALIRSGYNADEETVKKNLIKSMQIWGQAYPYAGYGGRFIGWLYEKEPKPYGSWGNGSAMRVSSVGYLYPTLERTLEVAKWTAEVSHNHPEGIKGAECTAAVVFLSRIGRGKTEIKEYVKDTFGYEIDTTVDEIRKYHKHDESCMDSLPKALVSFFEGNDYEDVVRNAVSLGGDTDTIGAIAGAMAGAYYGVPEELKRECRNRTDKYINSLIDGFEEIKEKDEVLQLDPEERRNIALEYACVRLREDEGEDRERDLYTILFELVYRSKDEGYAITPVIDVNNTMSDLNPEEHIKGDTVTLDKELRLRVDTLKDSEDKIFIPLYTSPKEIDYEKTAHVTINWTIKALIEDAYNREDVEALVINPFSTGVVIGKELLKMVIDEIKDEK